VHSQTQQSKKKIKSFEKLSKKTGTIRKTRAATGKGIASPPKPPGDFLRRRKSNKELDLAKPVKRLLTKRKSTEPIKVSRKGIARYIPKVQKVITMEQPNIPRAGRLNPRNRAVGGVGETKIGLGYPELNTENISPQGKIRVATLKQLIEGIVADANLLMMEGCNMRMVETLLTYYIKKIEDNLEKFEKIEDDIDGGNANGVLIYNEIITLNTECKILLLYCKTQIAAEPPAVAAAAAGQVKLARLSLPTFDGEGNYRNWKTDFDHLIVHVDNSMKKASLIDSLKGEAESYVKSVVTPEKTYEDIINLLAARYNDPLVVNYNLLDKIFNTPDMAKPQSTEKHWDKAIGNVNAVIASGMTIGEILIYYTLHKFQPKTVNKVKMMHKIRYPDRAAINLAEAVDLMNKVIAEEVELKKDSIALEQIMQGLTMTATTSSQFTAPAATPTPQNQYTIQYQNTMTPISQTQYPMMTPISQT